SSYAITNTTATEVKEIVINNLAPGQHTLELLRNNNRPSTKTSFTVREGYDLTITIASDGSMNTAEKRITDWDNGGNSINRPLTTNQFNKLYAQAKAKTSSATRATFLESSFNTSTKKMTAQQASQLIQLVN